MEFGPQSRVKFYHLIIKPLASGGFYIVRWGGRTALATRQAGVRTLRLLRSGKSVEQTHALLVRSGLPTTTTKDVSKFLDVLYRSDIIKSVNGCSVRSPNRVTPASLAHSAFRFYLVPRILTIARKITSFRITRSITYWVYKLDLKRAHKPKIDAVQRNIRTVLNKKSRRQYALIEREYRRHLLQNIADWQTFISSTPRRSDLWLSQATEFHGIQNLDLAASRGRGVILCAFHFSANKLIPFLLMQRGYNASVLALFDYDLNVDWVSAFQELSPSYGRLQTDLFGRFGAKGITTASELLKTGHVIVTMPDIFRDGTVDREKKRTAQLLRYFGVESLRSKFPEGKLLVDFLGHRVFMNGWAGWWSVFFSAPIVPSVLLRRKNGRYDLICEKAICPDTFEFSGTQSRNRVIDLINYEVFKTLEKYAGECPAQWFGWQTLNPVGGDGSVETQLLPTRGGALERA